MWRAACFLGCVLGAVVVLASASEARQRGEAVSGDAVGGQVLNLGSSGRMVARAQNRSSRVVLASHRTGERSAHATAGQVGDVSVAAGSSRDVDLRDVSAGLRSLPDEVTTRDTRVDRPRLRELLPRRSPTTCATAISRHGRGYAMRLACRADRRPVPITDLAVAAPPGGSWTGYWVAPSSGRCLATPRFVHCSYATTAATRTVLLYGLLPPGSPIGFRANGDSFAWTARAP